MSKERELLARVLESRTFMQGVALRIEIEELLAQPEPFKPDWANYRQGVADSKREPLSEAEIFNAWIPSKATPCVHSFKAGIKFAEKEHAIGVDYE